MHYLQVRSSTEATFGTFIHSLSLHLAHLLVVRLGIPQNICLAFTLAPPPRLCPPGIALSADLRAFDRDVVAWKLYGRSWDDAGDHRFEAIVLES